MDLFATKSIEALAADGQVTLANLNKVTAQLEVGLVELRALIATFKAIADDAHANGIIISLKGTAAHD
jgi:hypothetical protein